MELGTNSTLPKPGDTVADKYLIEQAIGRGGMSVVFGATHRVTGRRFAIKWLLPEVSLLPDAARRFIRESQVSGLVQHPNVVEVFDIGEERGSHYMVMEWLEGESLADRLERAGRLTLHEACEILIPCMRGVAAAHAAGIVHRDLKPANVFLCRNRQQNPGRPKVLDFGISKLSLAPSELRWSMTHTGVVMGTPYYMSPEQMQAQPVDARTDIYTFGVLWYEVLCGEVPFAARSYGELVLQIATATPPPLTDRCPGLAPEVAACIARAMARNPADRFQRLEDLIEAFESFASGEFAAFTPRPTAPTHLDPLYASSAHSETGWLGASTARERLQATSKRRRARKAGYVATCMLLVVGVALWLGLRSRASQPAANPSAAAAVAPEPETTLAQPLAAQPKAPAQPDPEQVEKKADTPPVSPHSASSKPPRRRPNPTRRPAKAAAPPPAETPERNPLHMDIQ